MSLRCQLVVPRSRGAGYQRSTTTPHAPASLALPTLVPCNGPTTSYPRLDPFLVQSPTTTFTHPVSIPSSVQPLIYPCASRLSTPLESVTHRSSNSSCSPKRLLSRARPAHGTPLVPQRHHSLLPVHTCFTLPHPPHHPHIPHRVQHDTPLSASPGHESPSTPLASVQASRIGCGRAPGPPVLSWLRLVVTRCWRAL